MLKVTNRLHLVNNVSDIREYEQIMNTPAVVKMHNSGMRILCELPKAKVLTNTLCRVYTVSRKQKKKENTCNQIVIKE